MSTESLLYIIISGIIALVLALFLYKGKQSISKRLQVIFITLRFLTIFSLLLLLINPKFNQITYFTEKPNLVIAIDNSASVKNLDQDKNVLFFLESIRTNSALKEKFELNFYSFGKHVNDSDSLSFSEEETNIDNVFSELSQVYKNTTAPIIMVTDGNQTLGNDYEYTAATYKHPVYPVILGDTISYTDLSIQQLNVNKYAFLKNKFPVECVIVYNGNSSVTSRFEVLSGKSVVYSEPVSFTKNINSKVLNFSLPANKVGVFSYKARVTKLDNEKNIINNTKPFAVEVIDQKTNIAIVSDYAHPDLGMLKKSIESNEQRQASILNVQEAVDNSNDFQLFILYQPNNSFRALIEKLDLDKKNKFTIIGAKSDLDFINAIYPYFNHDITNQTEDYFPVMNSNFAPFLLEDINFESFPPLKSNFGDISFSVPFETMLFKRIRNLKTNIPLLVSYEINGVKEALLLGENIWQWRAQSFLNEKTFAAFDTFIDKIIQYLASNARKERLTIDFESFYNGASGVIINAECFDKNFEFNTRENLIIELEDTVTNKKRTFPFILKNNSYQVDLSSLTPSDYTFTAKATSENISKSGAFKILEYNVEQQFLNANVTKLQLIATNSDGTSYFINNANKVMDDLLNDNRYQSIQKESKNVIPLIDWKYLLLFIAICLSLEWFLRKYNGLI